MLEIGDLVVGEDVTLEVPGLDKRYKTTVLYLDRRYAYVIPPKEANDEPVVIEPGTEAKLVVAGFGAMYSHPVRVERAAMELDPPRLALERTGTPERQESRAQLRLTVQLKTKMEVLGPDGAVKSTVQGVFQDLSAGGGRVQIQESLTRDTPLHVSIPLPGTNDVIETPAKIARVFPTIRKGIVEVGVQFLPTSMAVGDMVTKWILDQQRKRAVR